MLNLEKSFRTLKMLQYADNSLSFIQFFFFFAFKFIELISGFKQANFYSAVIKQIQRQSLMFYIASKPTKKKNWKTEAQFYFLVDYNH